MPTVDGLRRRVDKLQRDAGAGDGDPVTVHHVHAGGVEVMTPAEWKQYRREHSDDEFITVREILDCANS